MEEESKEPLFSPFWVFMIKWASVMIVFFGIGGSIGLIQRMF